jgi:4-amino-4-deoxy-L-arabinose transferase-like glycosyltransferase
MLAWLEKQNSQKIALFLLLIFIPLYLFYLGVPSLWDEDESIYAEISRQMLLRNDWVGTYFNYEPRFDKPPLNFWITNCFYTLFGRNEFTSRLGSTLFGLALLLLVFHIGERLYNRRAGILAALILGTSFLFFSETQLAIIDTALTFWVMLAGWWIFRGTFRNEPHYLFWMGLPLGLGILTKGPVTLALCGLLGITLWIYGTATRQKSRRDFCNLRLLGGVLLALAICLPWYFVMWSRFGMDFINNHFGYHMLQRATQGIESHGGQWWFAFYYLILIWPFLVPWGGGLMGSIKQAFQEWRQPARFYSLAWAGLIFLFFSIIQTKLPGYILPAFPPLALLLGDWWDKRIQNDYRSKLAWLGTAIQLLLAVGLAALFFTQRQRLPEAFQNSAPVLLLLPLALVIGTLFSYFWGKRSSNRQTARFETTFVLFYLFWALFMVAIVPLAETNKPVKYLAEKLEPQLRHGDRIVSYLPGVMSAPFYIQHPVAIVKNPESLAVELSRNDQLVFAITTQKGINYLREYNFSFHIIATHGNAHLISNRRLYIITREEK